MSRPVRAGVATAAAAGALFALAGHLGLLEAYGTVLPYRDQWQCTAVDLLGPWADGNLGLRNFVQPLNDHWPVLTRLLSFGLVRLNGQWNNLVETTVNALIFAGSVALFLRLILPGLQGWSRAGFAVLAGAVLALPITWENTLWGIQSLVYLQIALTLVYLGAVATQQRFNRLWWCGHAAGLAVLFTQHSAILAHVAAAGLLAWRWARHDGERRVAAAGLGFALVVIAAFVAFFPSLTVTAALRADSWQLALEVFLRQLAWPLPHPAWAFVVYLPWLVWMVNRLGARRMAAADAVILVLGLWVGGQAAAIGYGRAAETFTFASRYCDFLALGWLLNAACLGRLWLAHPRWFIRGAVILFGACWLVAPLKSFWLETSESHAGYNLPLRGGENARNLLRLRTWFTAHDAGRLTNDPGTQVELFTYPPALLPLLNQPRFTALLPPETGAPNARADHGRLGWLPAILVPSGAWVAGLGFVLLGGSLLLSSRRRAPPDAEVVEPSGHTLRTVACTTAAAALIAAGAWRAWTNPDVYDRTARLNKAYAPRVAGVSYADLSFRRYDGDVHDAVAARGAVDTLPVNVRIFWYGTRLKVTPDFRGVIRSESFKQTTRYLVVPFTGHPCFPGNGLRVRFTDPATRKETWVSYVGPDASVDWNMWTIDAAEHADAEAEVFLFDGLDGPTGWLGVARPALTNDSSFAAHWRAQLRAERAEPTHRTLPILAGALALLSAVLVGVDWARRRPRSA